MLKSKYLLIVFLAITLLSCQKSAKSPEVGNQAPSINLPDLEGNTVSLDSFKGNVVVINFWSYT